jgi:hypothetical protein
VAGRTRENPFVTNESRFSLSSLPTNEGSAVTLSSTAPELARRSEVPVLGMIAADGMGDDCGFDFVLKSTCGQQTMSDDSAEEPLFHDSESKDSNHKRIAPGSVCWTTAFASNPLVESIRFHVRVQRTCSMQPFEWERESSRRSRNTSFIACGGSKEAGFS